ncbi:serine hydrolase domain-containing protein [Microbacterium thalassium]|uniref:D-alanyl-D-alanine carboxypeptidase n=1 Tax=Microbacterium thalassium TaxID=362649 RepID=A0A7X0KTT1_9MICO|nr:serine hydrolase domain-containing protein [Microbacterium thalassium]MBB6390409.1 D-alanyl-D-alanine carboxypeptidase [Microbacterium thalassium]GLK25518.1 beta-lactamase [Microbacterium thalassium]
MPRRIARGRAGAAVAAVVALALGLSACSGEPTVPIDVPEQVTGDLPEETRTQLESAVTAAMEATGSTGAIVGVWAPWSGSWVAGLGTVTTDGPAVDPDMSFKAGRITRAMTCDVLYQLAEEGTVRLDDSVTTYVGGVANLGDVTLEQLCDSTSGIGRYYSSSLLAMWLSNPERAWKPQELAAFGLGAERTSDPGLIYRDSDAGYLLLGLALERATGKSAEDLIQEYVAGPLGLESTYLEVGVPSSDLDLLDGLRFARADGDWVCDETVDLTNMSGSIGYTDSGVISTISDLGRYAQALAAGTLMPSGTDRFDDPNPTSSSAPSWYSYAGGAFQAGTLIGSWGSVPGYLTAVFADAESGLAVAVVLNNSAASASQVRSLSWELAAIASKAQAAGGGEIPTAGLPWTAEDYHARIADNAICGGSE